MKRGCHYIPEFYFYSNNSANHMVMEGEGDDTLAKSAGFKYSLPHGINIHYFVTKTEADSFFQSVQGEPLYEEVKELPKLIRSSKERAAEKKKLSLDRYRNRVELVKQAITQKKRQITLMKKLSKMYKARTGKEYNFSIRYDFLGLIPEEEKMAKEIDKVSDKIKDTFREAEDPPRTMTTLDAIALGMSLASLFR